MARTAPMARRRRAASQRAHGGNGAAARQPAHVAAQGRPQRPLPVRLGQEVQALPRRLSGTPDCCETLRCRASKQVLIGKHAEAELAIIGLAAAGHLLIEDVPGVGKTMLAKSLARATGCTFKRIQFTPDLLPSDVTGRLDLQPAHRASSSFAPARSSPTWCSPTRSTAPRPRRSPRCSKRWRSTRSRSRASPARCRRRSWCWRHRTRSNTRAPSRCPRRSSTASCCAFTSGYPEPAQEAAVLERQMLRHPIEDLSPVTSATELQQLQQRGPRGPCRSADAALYRAHRRPDARPPGRVSRRQPARVVWR